MLHYQNWFYRIGLCGVIVAAAAFGLRIANDPNTTKGELEAGPASTIPGDGAPVSTPANVAVPFSIVTPVNGAHATTSFITLIGVGPPGATISALGNSITIASTGSWALSIGLTPGQNDILVTATDPDGESSSVTITVFYDPLAQATSTTKGTGTTKPDATGTTGGSPSTTGGGTSSTDTTPTSGSTSSTFNTTTSIDTTTTTEPTTTTTEPTTTTTEPTTTTTEPTTTTTESTTTSV